MPLKDAKIDILDGGLGMLPPSSSGNHAKVGVCSKGIPNLIISVTDPGQIAEKFGTGPLANALYDSFASGARTIYAVRATGEVDGVVGEVTATKTGTGNVTVSGTPLDAYELIVKIVDSGARNEATFKYSLDGGDTYTAKITVPTGLTYVIPDSGITLSFTEGVETANSFKIDDQYSCNITAPQASVNSMNLAIDVLLDSKYLYEYIHIVGAADTPVWAALAAKAISAETNFRFIHFLCEARGPAPSETVDEWVAVLLGAKSSFSSTRVAICPGRFEMADMGNGRVVDRNGAGIYSGRVSAIKVQESPGKVADGALPAVVALRPIGINEGHIQALDEAGFVTFRQYVGLDGFYVTNGRIAAPSISDFQYVEVRRPMDRACALVRNSALHFIQAEIDPTNLEKSFAAMEAYLSSPLATMAGDGGIARGRVVIPRDQNVLATSKVRVKVRIVPKATMREIEVEIGYENPFTEA